MAFHYLYPAPTDPSEVLTSTLRAIMAPYSRAPSRAEWHPAQRTQRCLYQGNQPCRQTVACAPRSLNILRRSSIFNPQVDVRETADAYVLQAALPGARPEDVQIQFSDNQTLVISGRIERVIEGPVPQTEEASTAHETTTTPTETTEPEPTASSTEAPEPTTAPTEAADHNDKEEAEVDWEEVNSTQYHSPTVEDDAEDEDSHSAVSTPKSETSKPTEPVAPVAETKKAETKEAEKAAAPSESPAKSTETHSNDKFWISERSVGEFSRGFTFAERIDQDRVSASLSNGILTVKVAKAPKHVARTVFLF